MSEDMGKRKKQIAVFELGLLFVSNRFTIDLDLIFA